MSERNQTRGKNQSKPDSIPDRKPLGVSNYYCIKKYGLYAYEVVKMDPSTYIETKIGVENVYGVVASDLVDLMFKDINGAG